MKIIQIGCNHSGTWAAKTLLNLGAGKNELVIYDKNDNISFLGCGIALWVDGTVKDPNTLFYSNPEELEALGAKIKMLHEVTAVDPDKKTVRVKNLSTGEEFDDNYDKLIVAAGSWPVIPSKFVEGCDLGNIYIAKWYQHAQQLVAEKDDPKIKKVAVIGAGYIGVELAEAFDKFGKEVYLIEAEDRVCANVFDKEIADHLLDGINENSNVKVLLNSRVKAFRGGADGKVNKIELTQKDEATGQFTKETAIDIDAVLMCVGFAPEILPILKDKVKTNFQGAMIVNENFESSAKDIYGIGDCIAQTYNPADETFAIMLASNAVRSGAAAALNILGHDVKGKGLNGSNAIHVFGRTLGGVGLTENAIARFKASCEKEGRKFAHQNIGTLLIEDNDKPDFIESREKMWVKVVYDKDTEEILGAQIASPANHAYEVYALSFAMQAKMKISEIGFVDTYFLPHFNKPVNLFNLITFKYLGIIK